jgi:hypothetical protein
MDEIDGAHAGGQRMKPTTGVMSLVIATVLAALTCDVPIVAGGEIGEEVLSR